MLGISSQRTSKLAGSARSTVTGSFMPGTTQCSRSELEVPRHVDRIGLRLDEDAQRPQAALAELDPIVERVVGLDDERDHPLPVCLSSALSQQAVSRDDARLGRA
jgi:hypothetical protein